jgi:diketogulonate reductase-like aldo/keto reductase
MYLFDSTRRRVLHSLALAGAGVMIAPRTMLASEAQRPVARTIPRSGESLPLIGLGTWQAFDIASDINARAEAADTLRAFIGAGLRAIDTSPMYGRAEAVVGELLEPIDREHSAFIATKVWTSGADAGRRQIENSFRLLRRKTIDLIQVHNLLDADAHLSTLLQMKRDGRVRYVGVTHYTASAHAALVKYIERGDIDFVQVNYSLQEREAEGMVLPAAAAHRVAVLINRPLGEGAILARVRGRELPAWAKELGCASWAQFALKWIIAHPAVTCVIPGTRNPAHLLDNIGAGSGVMPDTGMRARMAEYFDSL